MPLIGRRGGGGGEGGGEGVGGMTVDVEMVSLSISAKVI